MNQALVLDFGGVITRTLFETHDITEAELGLAPGTLTWRGPFDPDSDPLWRDMQAGRICERDYWLARTREVGRQVGETWERMETLVTRARGADPASAIRPEAVAAIDAAKAAGCRLAILSNELDLFYGRELRRRVDVLRHFDCIIDATYTGILKPDPRAYALCVEQLGVPAAACVFVDDQQRNVDGALRAGMRGVWFDIVRPATCYRRALKMLGVPLPAAL
ncbi:MAG: HAD family hydrolase [Rhodocyclaceae bacterium]|jgi:putative hydrolase of the HAD superfamily|nr:HAD family hydrolase [Rhodocyclaceae bacterium]